MRRPEEKDEELELPALSTSARKLADKLEARLLEFAETTVKEEGNRRYYLARGHEFAVIAVDHGRPLVDVKVPRPGSIAGASALRMKRRLHEGAHREGWVYVPLDNEEDVRAALEFCRQGYEEVLGTAPTLAVRKEKPLTFFDAPAPKRAKGSGTKARTAKKRSAK